MILKRLGATVEPLHGLEGEHAHLCHSSRMRARFLTGWLSITSANRGSSTPSLGLMSVASLHWNVSIFLVEFPRLVFKQLECALARAGRRGRSTLSSCDIYVKGCALWLWRGGSVSRRARVMMDGMGWMELPPLGAHTKEQAPVSDDEQVASLSANAAAMRFLAYVRSTWARSSARLNLGDTIDKISSGRRPARDSMRDARAWTQQHLADGYASQGTLGKPVCRQFTHLVSAHLPIERHTPCWSRESIGLVGDSGPKHASFVKGIRDELIKTS